jgi:hypothetical protein
MPAAFTIVLMLSACNNIQLEVTSSQAQIQPSSLTCLKQHAYSDLKPVIGQDEGSIDAGQLGGRHPEGYLSSKGAPTGNDHLRKEEDAGACVRQKAGCALTADAVLGSVDLEHGSAKCWSHTYFNRS